ncbi:sulfite oxidase, partial [Oceanithermus profundus]
RSLKGLALLAAAAAGPLRLARAAGDLWGRIRGLSPEITPTEDHYQVSKNVVNPRLRADRWRFEIGGLVETPLTLTLEDLKALPAVERPSTLICISNPVGGKLVGNSVWTGVRLRDLLERAGVRPEATELVLRAADNYSDSFPLEAALYEETILAYLQNGEPLTPDHGFPARLLVPGIYGMKNVKWLTRIELAGEDYRGYWQKRGWSDRAVVRTMSRIDTGVATPTGDGRVAIGGVAFAGRRGVRAVEVSFDDGRSWQAAELKPGSSRITWTLWRYLWKAEPGTYAVTVRAVDGEGRTQDPTPRPPLPDGATGYHRRKVRVV